VPHRKARRRASIDKIMLHWYTPLLGGGSVTDEVENRPVKVYFNRRVDPADVPAAAVSAESIPRR
jgi:hypothetical protein